MLFLEYIFYRIYRFQFLVGNHLTPVGTTILGLTSLIMFNLFSTFIIINYLTGYHIIFFNSSKLTALIFFILILLIICYLFLFKERYKTILKKYQKENKKEIRKGNLHIILFILFTLALLYFSLYLLYSKNF